MKNKNNKTAFTLIEMAIVLMVISGLMAAIISFSIPVVKSSKVKVTNDRIAAVYEALGSYAKAHYRLPCPASMTEAKTAASYGQERGEPANCAVESGVYEAVLSSNISYGMVPVKALGLSNEMAEDGFGNKLAYLVVDEYTASAYPDTLSGSDNFSFYKNTGIEMKAVSYPGNNPISGVILVVMSMGSNGYGAFSAKTAVQSATTSLDVNEQQNYLSSIVNNSSPAADVAAYGNNSHSVVSIAYENKGSDVFDDLVLFSTKNQFFADFDLNFLEACTTDGANYDALNYSDQAYYGQQIVSNNACGGSKTWVYPTKECGYGNVWIDKITCSP